MRSSILLSVSLICFSTAAFDALKESGITQGLCVVLPARDGDELIKLSNGGKMIVHGLCLDDATLEKARAALQGRGVYGPVSIKTSPQPTAASMSPARTGRLFVLESSWMVHNADGEF